MIDQKKLKNRVGAEKTKLSLKSEIGIMKLVVKKISLEPS